METSVLLSKTLGLCLVVIGAAIILRRHYFLPVFAAYVEQRLVRAVVSMIELAVGLLLVVHNVWSPLPAAIITLLGWMAVAEAIAWLFLPDTVVARLIGTFNTAAWYIVGGMLAIGVGLYLAGFGFGWW
ncbi:MAG: hypothetical protein GEV13_28825 [Rhodospirillales bacterium]|nr:hypothetical protein [Rhodospirillales bacterium]